MEAVGGIALVQRSPLEADAPPHVRLVQMFLAGRSKRTIDAYAGDLEHFRQFAAVSSIPEAAARLLAHGHGEANALVLEYRAYLQEQLVRGDPERKLSVATVNRRLAAVRSLVKLARVIGLVPWQLEVENLPAQPYRDTRGPGVDVVRAMLEATAQRTDAKGRRDYAILRLLHDLALRREEVASRDREHVSLDAGTIEILGKGRSQTEKLTLPEPTEAALRAWLEVRGDEPGPLFLNFDRAGKGKDRRLSADGLYRMVRELARRATGKAARPHGFRHHAITRALDLTHGDVRRTQRFSRHRDPNTVLRYDDNRRDLGGEVASLVAESAGVARQD